MHKNLTVNTSGDKTISKAYIHNLVNAVRKETGIKILSLGINFITGEEIEQINGEYLKHYYTTDIITFNYSGDLKNLDGELFISVDDAKENADKFKVTYAEEIKRLVIHGILHLIGYDDKDEADKKVMKKMEDMLVNDLVF